MVKLLVVHGPNLNLLGRREPDIYGTETLAEIEEAVCRYCGDRAAVEFFQSNHEGDIVERLQEAVGAVDGVIINPAAFTHYSYAIRDAVSALEVPVIEVHLSNIYGREDFRRQSVIAPVVRGQVSGLGKNSYLLASQALLDILAEEGVKEK